MKTTAHIFKAILIIQALFLASCEDFVQVDPPNNKLIQQEVFSNDNTTLSAMKGIYNQLFLSSYSNGSSRSVTYLGALSADNVQNIRTTNVDLIEFEENEITPDNEYNLDLWSSAYNIIYMTNSFLEGLAGSEQISQNIKDRLEGEARFVRAFTYFQLTNLYGDVPLVLTSNYRNNELAARNPQAEIYDQIISDLLRSTDLLPVQYEGGDRTQVNLSTANAFLARVYLYLENWEMAEQFSTKVINNSSTYEIIEDLDKVFLANSREAIWQLSPIGRGGNTQTYEGNLFIHSELLPFFVSNAVKDDFLEVFESNDKRAVHWVGFNDFLSEHFVFKYKIWNSDDYPIAEYSMVLRLAEQYFIRAEARTNQNNISGAIADINVIRNRAGISLISEENSDIRQEDLLDIIIEERRKELFAEWGHRWFDLKRTRRSEDVLGNKPLWEATDKLFPIPAEERMKNPNLTQNPGY